MGESVESVHIAFSYLEVAGITAMVRLTNAALSYGKKIANNLWSKSIGQIISGGKRRSQNISNAKFQLEGLGVAWEDISEAVKNKIDASNNKYLLATICKNSLNDLSPFRPMNSPYMNNRIIEKT